MPRPVCYSHPQKKASFTGSDLIRKREAHNRVANPKLGDRNSQQAFVARMSQFIHIEAPERTVENAVPTAGRIQAQRSA
jgi:hypothetical protein